MSKLFRLETPVTLQSEQDEPGINLEEALTEYLYSVDTMMSDIIAIHQGLDEANMIDNMQSNITHALEAITNGTFYELRALFNINDEMLKITGLESLEAETEEEKQAVLDACQEGLKDGAKKIWDNLIEFFRWLKNKVVAFVKRFVGENVKRMNAIKAAQKNIAKMKNPSIPPDTKMKALPSSELIDQFRDVIEVVSTLSFEKTHRDQAKRIEDALDSAENKDLFKLELKDGTASEFGFDQFSTVEYLLENAAGALPQASNELQQAQVDLDRDAAITIKDIERLTKSDDDTTKELEDMRTHQKHIQLITKQITGAIQLITSLANVTLTIASKVVDQE